MQKHLEEKLKDIVKNGILMQYLQALKDAYIPNSYLAAGIIRDTVWAHLFPDTMHGEPKDIDVPYYSETDPIEKMKSIARDLRK